MHVFASRSWLMPAGALDELEAAVARGPTLRTLALRRYAEQMRSESTSNVPSAQDRVLLERLVALTS